VPWDGKVGFKLIKQYLGYCIDTQPIDIPLHVGSYKREIATGAEMPTPHRLGCNLIEAAMDNKYVGVA
jgi:hypothetical protein